MKKAIFLDRDGVINVDHGYIYKTSEFEFISGVFEACRYFVEQGYLIVVVTNQSGIARGYYTEQDFDLLTQWMKARFLEEGITISNVYFCPHHPEKAEKGQAKYLKTCDCRKPAPGMLNQAIADFDIDVKNSIMVGDKLSDLQAAINAGVTTKILVRSGKPVLDETCKLADAVYDDLYSVIKDKSY